MTGRERIMRAVRGEPTDRVPFSLWYHFHLDPPAGAGLARAELDFAARYRPDLLKVMHDIPYEMPSVLPSIETPDDWPRLPVLDGAGGHFGQQLEAVRMILDGRAEDYPVVVTVFGVGATAEKISNRRVFEHLHQGAERVEEGLEALTRSICAYVHALVELGVDGIYLAVVGAAADTMAADSHRTYFAAREQRVLDTASEASLNVIHHHGVGIYPENVLPLRGYAIYSWSDRLAGNPSIKEMRLRTQACLMCGVNELTFGTASPDEILAEARDALQQSGGRRFILAPGCAVPTPPACREDQLRSFERAVTLQEGTC